MFFLPFFAEFNLPNGFHFVCTTTLPQRYANSCDAAAGHIANAGQCSSVVFLCVFHFWNSRRSTVGGHFATTVRSSAARSCVRTRVSFNQNLKKASIKCHCSSHPVPYLRHLVIDSISAVDSIELSVRFDSIPLRLTQYRCVNISNENKLPSSSRVYNRWANSIYYFWIFIKFACKLIQIVYFWVEFYWQYIFCVRVLRLICFGFHWFSGWRAVGLPGRPDQLFFSLRLERQIMKRFHFREDDPTSHWDPLDEKIYENRIDSLSHCQWPITLSMQLNIQIDWFQMNDPSFSVLFRFCR